jgi:hypothetical protein
MRLILAAAGMVLLLGSTALAQPAPPDPVAPAQRPVNTVDLRAPDQIAPAQPPVNTVDLRAPDQIAPAQPPVDTVDLRAPDQSAPAALTTSAPTPVVDDGPAAIVFVLIGLGAAIVLLAGGYLGLRFRRRAAIADDLVTGS